MRTLPYYCGAYFDHFIFIPFGLGTPSFFGDLIICVITEAIVTIVLTLSESKSPKVSISYYTNLSRTETIQTESKMFYLHDTAVRYVIITACKTL